MPRRYGYPRVEAPDTTTVQGVPYISMYNPQDYEDYSKILQNAQQRYDVGQAAIAQSLRDYSDAEVSKEYQPRLQEIVDAKYEDLNKLIQDKYSGDYGNAANEIVNQLALIRKPISGAVQASKAREEARKLYQQQALSQNVNSEFFFNKDTGKVERRQLDFDEIVGKQDIFDESGRFIGTPDYMGKFRGASNLSKYIEENISKYMNDEIKQTGLKKHPGVFGYLMQETTKGRSDTDIMNDFIDSKTGAINQNGVALARQLRSEANFFGDEAKNLTDEQVVNYALPIIQGQVREQKLINPEFDKWAEIFYKERMRGKNTGNRLSMFNPVPTEVEAQPNEFVGKDIKPYSSVFNDYDFKGVKGAGGDNLNSIIAVTKNRIKEAKQKISDIDSNKNKHVLSGEGIKTTAIERKSLEENIKLLENYIKEANEAKADVDDLRDDLKKRGDKRASFSDRQLAQMLDEDNSLKKMRTNLVYTATVEGRKVMNAIWKNNPAGSTGMGYQIGGSKDFLTLRALAEEMGRPLEEVKKEIEEQTPSNYDIKTGTLLGSITDDDGKTHIIRKHLDVATRLASNALTNVLEVENNSRQYKDRLKSGPINVGGDANFVIQLTDIDSDGGKYSIIDRNRGVVSENVPASVVQKTVGDNYIIPVANRNYLTISNTDNPDAY